MYSDYVGSADITDERVKMLSKSYFANGYTSEYTNWKFVAYLCDTEAWNVYKGTNADYAIGSPTLEIFLKSYSQYYNVDYRAYVRGSSGYAISIDGGNTSESGCNELLDAENDLYCIQSSSYYLWLACASSQRYAASYVSSI